jgi:hypothetical protein
MSCRIGITTDPERRRGEWGSKYPTLKNWEIIAGPYKTKGEAQAMETDLSQAQGCEAAPGGDNPSDPRAKWYVYRFDH